MDLAGLGNDNCIVQRLPSKFEMHLSGQKKSLLWNLNINYFPPPPKKKSVIQLQS